MEATNKVGINFKHLSLTMDNNPLTEDQFLFDLEQLLRKYAGTNWTYNYRVDEMGDSE